MPLSELDVAAGFSLFVFPLVLLDFAASSGAAAAAAGAGTPSSGGALAPSVDMFYVACASVVRCQELKGELRITQRNVRHFFLEA